MRFKNPLILFFALLALFLLQTSSLCYAQESTVEAWDDSRVDVRKPSQEAIDQLKANEDYIYKIEEREESAWDRFWRWFWSKLLNNVGDLSWTGWVLLGLAVIALLAIIIRLFKIPIKSLFVFSRATKVTDLNFWSDITDLENEALEKNLHEYITNGAYREATRILFLIALRQLNRNKLIAWDAWKTDREYYYELKDEQLRTSYNHVMRHYEYVWFGHYLPHQEQFNIIKQQFDNFLANIEERRSHGN